MQFYNQSHIHNINYVIFLAKWYINRQKYVENDISLDQADLSDNETARY